MEFLVNDLSIHGQFSDIAAFRDAINRMMAMRQATQSFGRELHCHRNIAGARVTPDLTMPQAIRFFSKNEQRALMQWLTKQGPFWEDMRIHGDDDYLECRGDVVTDTAVGEAAYCCFHRIDRRLVSLAPSSWVFSPVSVTWVADANDGKTIDVLNYWEADLLQADLQALPVPLESWGQLETVVIPRFRHLTFSVTCFDPLRGSPFNESTGQRILVLLGILDRLRDCFDEQGKRTPEGHEIYQSFFTGKKGDGGRGPLFSDSTQDEKREFRTEMTFAHPADAKNTIFCPWHGKVQTPQFRVHFSWPVRADEPLFVVYVGPKITKR